MQEQPKPFYDESESHQRQAGSVPCEQGSLCRKEYSGIIEFGHDVSFLNKYGLQCRVEICASQIAINRTQYAGVFCAGDLRQVGWLAVQGLLRQPGEGDGFKIIAVHPEGVGCFYTATRQ